MKPERNRCVPVTILTCLILFLAASSRTRCVFAGPLRAGQEAGEEPDYAWAPALLYDVISSASPEALNSLYDAVFVAGPAAVPQLEAALKDDRTAEFAAQSLAFIGGEEAFTALSRLVSDPRDLDLRRFYYGALAELGTRAANNYLLNVIGKANSEPDRTVTEAAIIALTVHSSMDLIPQLKQIEVKLTDPVIQDDLDNAMSVIQDRAQYQAIHKTSGGSLQGALNLYFEAALKAAPATSRRGSPTQNGVNAARSQAVSPAARVEIEHIEFSSDQTRALARVSFKDEGVTEPYKIVFQKRYGNWTVASVWLGLGEEGTLPGTGPEHRARSGAP